MRTIIWCDQQGEGRNLHGMFRRSFEIDGDIRTAELTLFADSVYELYVNGRYVEFGPARFDPRFPEYDVHDLTPWLTQGVNVIAVLVKHFGCSVFRAMPARAGLLAGGRIETETASISLESGPDWKTQPSNAYRADAPKMSFALEPMEVFDQSAEPAGWREADFDDTAWPAAVPLGKQDAWGPPAPRSIPFMSGREVPPSRVLHCGALRHNEDVYSFHVPAFHWYTFHFDTARRKEYKAVLFSTWIYSPAEQDVTAGLFWGEHWLNGELLAEGTFPPDASMRTEVPMHLKKGWNSFFGKIDVYFEIIDFYLGLPVERGLKISADRDETTGVLFRRTDVLRTEEYNALGGDAGLPFAPDGLPPVSCGWTEVTAADPADNPARERDWDRFGPDLPAVTPETLPGRVFRKEDFPNGFAVELDMGAMRLLKPEVELAGVDGASVDFAYSEYLHDGERLKMFPTHEYHAASRAVCSRDTLTWSPMQPHGFRYLALTVRNPQNDITLKRITCRSAEYPVEQTGTFTCSDPLLNKIWSLCRRTEMTDMEDAYIDCPGRERGMYIRDTIIQYHNNLAMFGDQKLMRRCMALYGRSAAPDGKFRATYPFDQDYTIADFSLNAVEGFWNYVQQTGDLSVVEDCWEAIQNNLQWFHELSDEREDGLLDADWHLKRGKESRYMGFHGDNQPDMRRDGVSSGFSCFYLSALTAAAHLADRLDDPAVAAACRRRYAQVKESVNRLCWDSERGTYADTIEKKSFSPQAALLAVRAGVPDHAQREALRAFFKQTLNHLFINEQDPSGGVRVSPHFCFYLFETLYDLDLAGLAEQLMREGWSWMMKLGTATCTEFFMEEGSWCHAWAASPAYYLSKYALGVQVPGHPDQDQVEIRVKTGSLQSAEGVWPHPKGPIHVKWHMENGRRVFDRIDTPDGVRAAVCD